MAFVKSMLLAALTLFIAISARAQESDSTKDETVVDKRQLLGTWRLVEAKNPGTPSGITTRLKLFTETHWAIIQAREDGNIVFVHGGTYTLDGNTLKTNHDFAGSNTLPLIGRTIPLTIKIEGDRLTQADDDGIYVESWEKVQPKAIADNADVETSE